MALEDEPTGESTPKNFVVLILSCSGGVHSTVIEGFKSQKAGDAVCVRIRDSDEFRKAGLRTAAICFEKK